MNPQVSERIKKDIAENQVLLYMKGTKTAPMCGFSAQVIQVLNSYGVTFKDVNILDDWDLREGIKEYSSWPTLPQLYINGKFIGGCDITMELHRKGELKKLLNLA